ncbi:MAG TPA: hypothetical protein VNN12_08830 [Dehalococcoidia bacterium]|nr:hypothetical protein [Dehalococcoidia bacterium]
MVILQPVRNHIARFWGLWLACAVAFAAYAPTLGYHFSFDDMVPLSDMATKPFSAWLTDVLRLRDATPSWRPLTMLVYRVEYALFGMNAAAFRSVNLGFHIANVGLVYVVTNRLVRHTWIAAFVAAAFGVFGGAWDTVSYITALPHVLALTFFLLSLWLLLEFVDTGEADNEVYLGSFAFFLLAFLANEASVTFLIPYAVAYGLAARRPLDLRKIGTRLAPFFLVAIVFGLVFTFCPCREQMTVEQRWEWISLKQAYLYLAWMLLPVGQAPYEFHIVQWVAGGVSLALLAWALARGAAWTRWALVTLVVFLLPYVLIDPITAGETVVSPRYVYSAAFPYLLVLAWAGRSVLFHVQARRVATTCAAAVSLAAILGYSVETGLQNREVLQVREPAQYLLQELETRYKQGPIGQRVFLVGEPWTNPFFAFAGIPAITKLVFGEPALIYVEAWEPTVLDAYLKARDYRIEPWEHVLQYRNGSFRELTADDVREEAQRARLASQNH